VAKGPHNALKKQCDKTLGAKGEKVNQTIGANAPKGIMNILNSSKALMV
jgi:hypothetical protein